MSYLDIVFSNLRQNWLRAVLTGGAVALAVALICLLLTLPVGIDAILDRVTSNTRISVSNEAGLIYDLPYSLGDKVRRIDGVEAALGVVWFGGALGNENRVTFPSFAVEPEHVGAVYPDWGIPQPVLEDFERYRDGALVGRQTMREHGWEVGQRVTLASTAWPVALDLRVVGEIPRDTSPLVFIHREYLSQALLASELSEPLSRTQILWVRVSEAERADDVMLEIDELTRNSGTNALSQSERSFFESGFAALSALAPILLFVCALITLCIACIAANTSSMTIRERTLEIAVLRALGFGRGRIFLLLLGDSVAVCGVAGVLGVGAILALTYGLRLVGERLEFLGPLGALFITPEIVAIGLTLAFCIGLGAGVPPAVGAVRQPVSTVLRRIF